MHARIQNKSSDRIGADRIIVALCLLTCPTLTSVKSVIEDILNFNNQRIFISNKYRKIFFLIIYYTFDVQSTGRILHSLVLLPTYFEMTIMKQRLNHQSM